MNKKFKNTSKVVLIAVALVIVAISGTKSLADFTSREVDSWAGTLSKVELKLVRANEDYNEVLSIKDNKQDKYGYQLENRSTQPVAIRTVFKVVDEKNTLKGLNDNVEILKLKGGEKNSQTYTVTVGDIGKEFYFDEGVMDKFSYSFNEVDVEVSSASPGIGDSKDLAFEIHAEAKLSKDNKWENVPLSEVKGFTYESKHLLIPVTVSGNGASARSLIEVEEHSEVIEEQSEESTVDKKDDLDVTDELDESNVSEEAEELEDKAHEDVESLKDNDEAE